MKRGETVHLMWEKKVSNGLAMRAQSRGYHGAEPTFGSIELWLNWEHRIMLYMIEVTPSEYIMHIYQNNDLIWRLTVSSPAQAYYDAVVYALTLIEK